MGVDLRQVVAGILTLTMFVMLGNMIKRDHFDSVEVSNLNHQTHTHTVLSDPTLCFVFSLYAFFLSGSASHFTSKLVTFSVFGLWDLLHLIIEILTQVQNPFLLFIFLWNQFILCGI